MPNDALRADLGSFLAAHDAELIDFRRDMHAHPELGYHEHRATRRIALRLAAQCGSHPSPRDFPAIREFNREFL